MYSFLPLAHSVQLSGIQQRQDLARWLEISRVRWGGCWRLHNSGIPDGSLEVLPSVRVISGTAGHRGTLLQVELVTADRVQCRLEQRQMEATAGSPESMPPLHLKSDFMKQFIIALDKVSATFKTSPLSCLQQNLKPVSSPDHK